MNELKRKLKRGTYSLAGKTVAINGATGGLGRQLCFRFCALGASLILIDRNKERSLSLISELKASFPKLCAEHITLDLEDFDRVVEVTDELCGREIDFLVLNAGAYSIPRHKCSTGFDNVYQINFLSPYYMASRLLPILHQRGGRVVAVSSIAHNYSKIDENDVDFSSVRAASKVYGNAKRYLTYALFELDGYGKSVVVAHPGIAVTNITAHYPKVIYALIKYPMKVIFMSAKKASLSILCALFEDCADSEWIGPWVLNIWGYPKKQKLNTADATEREKIRKIACEEVFSGILAKK